jgi:hypothetical protein
LAAAGLGGCRHHKEGGHLERWAPKVRAVGTLRPEALRLDIQDMMSVLTPAQLASLAALTSDASIRNAHNRLRGDVPRGMSPTPHYGNGDGTIHDEPGLVHTCSQYKIQLHRAHQRPSRFPSFTFPT